MGEYVHGGGHQGSGGTPVTQIGDRELVHADNARVTPARRWIRGSVGMCAQVVVTARLMRASISARRLCAR
ncbi:MAG: hypothetical protein JOZ48_09545 [Acidobacteriaceae bacterium]|nr:hypothetical protein [Acidobacteriaceae bacterium]